MSRMFHWNRFVEELASFLHTWREYDATNIHMARKRAPESVLEIKIMRKDDLKNDYRMYQITT